MKHLLFLLFSTLFISIQAQDLEPVEQDDKVSLEDEKAIFTDPDQIAMFPGCDPELEYSEAKSCMERKFLEFTYQNIQYPEEARRIGVEGMVVVSFLISPEGRLSEFKILRDLAGGCGKEAQRVFQSMPDWIPAEHDGEKVWQQFNAPVRFKLEGPGKIKKKKKRRRG